MPRREGFAPKNFMKSSQVLVLAISGRVVVKPDILIFKTPF
jgi:hypothetical protein